MKPDQRRRPLILLNTPRLMGATKMTRVGFCKFFVVVSVGFFPYSIVGVDGANFTPQRDIIAID